MATIEIQVPDIGDFEDVPVIELLVKPGDVVAKDESLRHARERQGHDGGALAARRRREALCREGRRQGLARHA